MALTSAQRAVYIEEVQRAYDAYQDTKKAVESKVRAEVEKRIAVEHGSLLVDLSKMLHEYHRKGLSKAGLREATRKYGNGAEFAKLWDAYEPEDAFSLAVGRSASPTYEFNELGHLVWYKDKDGNNYPHPLVFSDYSTRRNEVYIPDILDDVVKEYGWTEFAKEASKAIAAAFEAGTIPARETIYDQRLDYEDATKAKAYRDNLNNDWKK
jgi:hypothetical protein